MCACVIQFCLEIMSNDKEDYIQAITGCRKKLGEINQKLLEIKKKHVKMKDIYPTRYGKKHCAILEENYRTLMKEAELIERDLAFATSMVESASDSFTAKLMKRVLPGRNFYLFGRETSKEFKVSLMSHSTKFLEDKVMSLENLTKKQRRKKTEVKNIIDGDFDFSVINNCSSSSYKSDEKLKAKNENTGKVENRRSLEMDNHNYVNEHVAFNSDICSESSVFALDILKKERGNHKRYNSLSSHNTESAEKFAQTENLDYFQSVESSEKSIQTDEVEQCPMPEIYEAFKKIAEYHPCNRTIQESSREEDSGSLDFSEWKVDNVSPTGQTLELMAAMKEVIVPSVWSSLQSKKLSNDLFPMYLETAQHSNFNVEMFLIPRIKDNFQDLFENKLNLINKRREIGHRCVHYRCYAIPEIWFIKENMCVLHILEYDFPNVFGTKSLDVFPKLLETSGVAVQVIKTQSKHEPLRNTLQIDYCNNSEGTGRIVLTEFSNDQCCIQSEIFARVVTYLLGLRTSTDKS